MINKFSILNGAKYFSSGIFQNYLVFIPAIKHIKYFHGTTQIYSWKSNGMSEESIENITKSDSNFASTFVDHYLLPDMNFNEHCLTKNKFASAFVDRNLLPGMNFNGHCLIKNNIYFPQKVINLYISYT